MGDAGGVRIMWRKMTAFLAVLLFVLHLAVAVPLCRLAYALYDTYWSRAEPAFAVPEWGALLFFPSVAAAFGVASRVWNRRSALLSGVPVSLGFFFWLGSMRYSEFVQVTLWDAVGRPPMAALAVGIGSGVAAALGHVVSDRVIRMCSVRRRNRQAEPQS